MPSYLSEINILDFLSVFKPQINPYEQKNQVIGHFKKSVFISNDEDNLD